MALTTGKRTTTVTPSATASRMGIVPAYGCSFRRRKMESKI